MSNETVKFLYSIQDGSKLRPSEHIDVFAYFLTVIKGKPAAKVREIENCFRVCDLPMHTRISQYLSENANKKPPRYLKVEGGYRLQLNLREEVGAKIGVERIVLQTSNELRELESRIPAGPSRAFLKETIDCFEIRANRATIVMCWLLAIDHLCNYILKHHTVAFNAVLAANNDRRIKISAVSNRDDFSEIPEGKFIEFCRSSGVISNDVRKILDSKLGTRNSAAHPSMIEIASSKVIDFVEDLVINVVMKYPL